MKNPSPMSPKIATETELMSRSRFIVIASISDKSGLAIAVISLRACPESNLAFFRYLSPICSDVVCQPER